MGKKKDKKNKGGTGSEYFDYRYGVGEAKHMMERYGVEGASMGNPRMGGKQRSVDEVKDDLAKAMMNDYDTRRSLEAAAMAGNKDAKKYAKKGIKGKNIQDAYGVMRDLKKEYVGGGGMGGAENRASLTQALVQADRDNFIADNDAKYAAKSDLEQMEEADKGFTYEGPDKEISPEMQEAKDRVAAYESNSGLGDPTPYGTKGSIFSDAATAVYGGAADDQQAEATMVADSADKAQGFLAQQKEKMKRERNFKRDF